MWCYRFTYERAHATTHSSSWNHNFYLYTPKRGKHAQNVHFFFLLFFQTFNHLVTFSFYSYVICHLSVAHNTIAWNETWSFVRGIVSDFN